MKGGGEGKVGFGRLSEDGERRIVRIGPEDLIQLPAPYDDSMETEVLYRDRQTCLDGFDTLSTPEVEEEGMLSRFVEGLRRLMERENNWTFLRPLLLSLEYCAGCQACCEACPVYIASGRKEIYKPTYRAEILRRLVRRYVKPFGRVRAKLAGGDLELSFALLKRLYELSYRCTLCRRCALACPMGIDNSLVTREIRKLFSQQLGWTPEELHEKGTKLQLETGSVTGMGSGVLKENVDFIVEEYSQSTGFSIEVPWDKKGAEFLLLPTAGGILADPQNFAALIILLNLAGIDFTMSSEAPAYDGVNFGLFYNDIEFSRVLFRQARVVKALEPKGVLLTECGHQHKVFLSAAERLLPGDLRIPVQDLPNFLERLVFGGGIRFDHSRNDFPVTLHDPCNMVRSLGIIDPQRKILRYLCPDFREMSPNGVENYCCGGGGGLVLLGMPDFKAWRTLISGRMKFRQILEAFSDQPGPERRKYVCAPCLNCRLQIRDLLNHYKASERSAIYCGGLSDLVLNAVKEIRTPFIKWEEF